MTGEASYTANFVQSVVTPTLSLNAGWNWVSLYVEGDPVDMLDVLKAGLGGNALQIQGKNAVTEFDGEEWFGDLEVFEPGEGLMYFSSSTRSKTLTFSVNK